MNQEQAAKMLLLLERIAVALEKVVAAPQAAPSTEMHIVEQPLTINLPRTEQAVASFKR